MGQAKKQIHGRSPMAILQQNERDDARLFFRIKNHPFHFAPTHNSRPSRDSFRFFTVLVCLFLQTQYLTAQNNIFNQQPSALQLQRQQEQQRINQQNQQVLINQGYRPPVVPPSDPALRHQFIIDQYNQSKNPSKQTKQLEELRTVLEEEKREAAKRNASAASANPKTTAENQQRYINAYNTIKGMLDGKTNLSVKDAYFQIESAYGNTYQSQAEYNKTIASSADFIKKWLAQNGYNLSDNNALNIGIQRFMSDTLTITVKIPDSKEPPKTITHLPFFYDYNDFKGERDFRNYFATKTLATGSGQCNSLPAVYLILAEAIGAKAYLSFAPMHSFIKYPDSKGAIKNYEPTSNWNIGDDWYQDNMFISEEAKKKGIYLDTLNKRQVIANCLIDLSASYIWKQGVANDTLLRKCVSTAVKNFPRDNNINFYFINSSFLKHQMFVAMQQDGVTDINNIQQSPKATAIYQEFLRNEETILKLGYQDMPVEAYKELMQQHEFKGRKQAAQNISGKEKRNQFVEIN